MKVLGGAVIESLWHDEDKREESLRQVIGECLAERPAVQADGYVGATYFFALRSLRLDQAVEEISYHATSGIRHPPADSLLEECTAKCVGIDAFDSTGRMGLVHMAFPLKMLRQADGHLTSCDLLHTLAGAIIFDVYENQDARLVQLQIPDEIIETFPGPAHGPEGIRKIANFTPKQPAFGTILKPTAGITPDQVGNLVEQAASCPLFLFVKEDENLYPNLDYSPVQQRTREAMAGIERARERRGDVGIIFAPHITGGPHEILATVQAVLEAGATGLMFSETFAGGVVRMVREATRHLELPPAIYGHNAGIGVKTKGIWREVIDLLARLDGIDFRQTAPVRMGPPFIRPYGAEWLASEDILSRPLPGIKPTMIVRAGGLDQGNICLNLADAEKRGIEGTVLYLAGSAINSIKNREQKPDPKLGADAMMQALSIHHSGELKNVPGEHHVRILKEIASRTGFKALTEALQQRYPGQTHAS